MGIFSPDIYIQAGSTGTTASSQEALETALATGWDKLEGSTEGKLEETLEGGKTLGRGYTFYAGKKIAFEAKNMQVTLANFNHLRGTYHNILSTIILNEKATVAETGVLVQVKGIRPTINLVRKQNDTAIFDIKFNRIAGLTSIVDISNLTADAD